MTPKTPTTTASWAAAPDAGWPFWWRFVLATNLGWGPGIALGLWLASGLPATAGLARACVAAFVAALCFGAAQAVVLRPVLASGMHWWIATTFGWTLGVGLARLAIDRIARPEPPLADLPDAIAVAFIAGTLVGLAQAPLLAHRFAVWTAWPLVSAIGWGVMFPGALPGLALVWMARRSRSETQPMSLTPLSPATRLRLEALFDGAQRAEAERLMAEDCGRNLPFCEDHGPEQLERIRFAALKLSDGRLEALVEAIVLAQTDWRDLLVSADFANDVHAHASWFPDPVQRR